MLPTATPESQGLPSAAVLALIDRLEREGHDPHGLVILRDGHEIAAGWWAPYARERVHRLYSLSKSFTAIAVGLAVHEGRLSVDDPVLGFFPDLAPTNPSENLRAMRICDLLTMSCGHDVDASGEFRKGDGWARAFLAAPVPHAPGTHFVYNSGATYMLSAILARVTGEGLLDYLRPRLLDPLGVDDARWETDPDRVAVGGWGLYLTTDAIARFGQLLLQQGRWGESQLIPEAWIEAATSKQVDNSSNENPDWRVGYGYQFWRSRHGFRADGAFGQFCLVLPERRLVVALTGSSDDLQGVLNAVWEEILAKLSDSPLPDDPDAFEALKSRLSTLCFPKATGESRQAPMIGGLMPGAREWIEIENGLEDLMPGPLAISAAWRPLDESFLIRLLSLESTESMWVKVRDDHATYQMRGTWGPREGTLEMVPLAAAAQAER